MDLLGLFISISIGVGIVSYFEGRRVGRNEGFKKGHGMGLATGLIIASDEKFEVRKVETMDGVEFFAGKREVH
jgi:hypothetical protein